MEMTEDCTKWPCCRRFDDVSDHGKAKFGDRFEIPVRGFRQGPGQDSSSG